MSYGLISSVHPQPAGDSQFQNLQTPPAPVKISPVQKQITINIEDAVQKPGVYKVSVDAQNTGCIDCWGGWIIGKC